MKKVVLVTGASRGLGKAIAKRFHEKNCIVVANYNKSASEAFALVDQLNKDSTAGNPSAIAIKCNVFVPEEVDTMIRCIIEKYSRIDILVNNAGVRFDKLTPRMTVEEFTSTLHNNVVSAFYCSQQCIVKGGMLKHRWGRIINMSSVVGMRGNAGQANYAASKAAIIGMTKSMAKEFASRNITVNCVCPGFIDSDMTKHLSWSQDTLPPMGRLGKPEEVASLVEFLALSEASNYITGHNFVIDGGLSI